MMAGGIYDQLGGGFARYSVDAAWLVPHFEKMLYDNALLARAYLHGWQALGHERYRRVCEETLDWVLREMRGPEGGFYSALDADSEGEEGRFYVWTPERDLDGEVLGRRTARLRQRPSIYGVSEAATSRGATSSTCPAAPMRRSRRDSTRGAPCSLRGPGEARLARPRRQAPRLLERPDDRRPGRGRRGPRPRGLPRRRPRAAPSSCWGEMRDADGRLLRTYKDGRAHLNAYLEDHAFLLEALLALYEATFERRWFERRGELAETMIERFGDPERGGFFSTSDDHEQLIARRKEVGDHPIPSGNSAAALGLLRLAALTGERRYEHQAEGVLRLFAESGGPPPRGLRPPAAGARLPPLPDQGGGPGRRRARASSPAWSAPSIRPHLVLAGGAAGQRARPPLLADRRRSTEARPPTSARASPARRRSPTGTQLSALL